MNYFSLIVLCIMCLNQVALGNNCPLPCISTIESQVDTTVYTIVEVPPEFPGGINALKKFISTTSNIPIASKNGERTVLFHLMLLVERDGRISAIKVKRVGSEDGFHQEKYEREARRIVSEMPEWKPGSQDGRLLRVYALVPILFEREL